MTRLAESQRGLVVLPVPALERVRGTALFPPARSEETRMAHVAKFDSSDRMRSRAVQKRLCQRITFVTACFLVPVVVARRAVKRVAGTMPGGPAVSVFAEARSDASAIIPYIFMG